MSYRHKASERAAPAAGANGGGVDATLGPSLRGNWDRDFWAMGENFSLWYIN